MTLFPSIFVDNRQISNDNKGKILTMDGIDASGKRTQSGLLLRHFMRNDIPCTFYSFPDYTTNSGILIKKYLQGNLPIMTKREFEKMNMINKLEKKRDILEHLNNGYYVVCDRYIESQYVYGQLEGFELDYIQSINEDLPQSDIVFILDLPIRVIKKRLETRKRKYGRTDKYEENIDFLSKAREKYLELAQKFDNWIVIDCYKKTMKQINQEIISKLTLVLKVI